MSLSLDHRHITNFAKKDKQRADHGSTSHGKFPRKWCQKSRKMPEKTKENVARCFLCASCIYMPFRAPQRTLQLISCEMGPCIYRLVYQCLGYKLVWVERICGQIRQLNMRDMVWALCHGGGWLVSMQHFCLHASDCTAFAIWYGLVVGGVVVALCTFCDALTSPVNICDDERLCGLGLLWLVAKQASTMHNIIMHALHIGLHMLIWKGAAPRCSGCERTVRTRWHRNAPAVSTLVYPSRLVYQISYCGTCLCSSAGMW